MTRRIGIVVANESGNPEPGHNLMKTDQRKKHSRVSTLTLAVVTTFGLGVAPLSAQPQPTQQQQQQQQVAPQQSEAIQRLQEVQQDLQEVETKLAGVRQQAGQKEEVRKAAKPVEKAIYTSMKKTAPDLEDEVEKLEKLTNELRASDELTKSAEERSEEFTEDLNAYQELKQQLAPVERQAFQDEKVTESMAAYQETLNKAMVEIEPKAMELFSQQNELTIEFQQLQQQLQQRQQGGARQVPAPQSGQ